MFWSVMSSSVRNDLKLIFESSVNAVKPNSLIKSFIELKDNELLIKDSTQEVKKRVWLYNRDIYILGAGKAVLNMCEEFLNQLERYNSCVNCKHLSINRGLLSVPIGSNTNNPLFAKYNVEYRTGALNNMPDLDSQTTTQEIVNLIKSAKFNENNSKDIKPLIISFISGGGSALLSLPKPGITLDQKCSLISKLVKSGATIDQLNCVRSCLSQVKCGKLAQLALQPPSPLQMICFIISDIINDPIELIASGPTVVHKPNAFKPSENVFKILNKLNIEVKENIKNIIESEDKQLDSYNSEFTNNLDNIIIGNNRIALNVAQNTANSLGYKVIYLGNTIKGEAKDVAIDWARIALDFKESEDIKKYKGVCWIGGGETTVNMRNTINGVGGRCQEMCLAFYRTVYNTLSNEKVYFLCAGTDGQDGPTDVAGVIAENIPKNDSNEQIWIRSEIDLTNHNSHEFFKIFYKNWFIKSGITGTNVMDIYCLIKTFNSS